MHTEPGKCAVQEALMPNSISALKMLVNALGNRWRTHYVENGVGEILGEWQWRGGGGCLRSSREAQLYRK